MKPKSKKFFHRIEVEEFLVLLIFISHIQKKTLSFESIQMQLHCIKFPLTFTANENHSPHIIHLYACIITDHDQHSNNCGDDNCSPFCICSCCSSGIDYPVKLPLQIKTPPPIVEANPSFVPNNIPFSFNSAVWHPPTLS